MSSNSPGNNRPRQPVFPPRTDENYGFYQPITSLEKSLSVDFINLVRSNPGEWPMEPELGVGLQRYLFEQEGSDIIQDLQSRIINQTRRFLPSVKLLKLEIMTPESSEMLNNQNLINLRITYLINGSAVGEAHTERDKDNKVKIVVDGVSKFTSSFRDRVQNLPSDESSI